MAGSARLGAGSRIPLAVLDQGGMAGSEHCQISAEVVNDSVLDLRLHCWPMFQALFVFLDSEWAIIDM